jgi:hypothetical protein
MLRQMGGKKHCKENERQILRILASDSRFLLVNVLTVTPTKSFAFETPCGPLGPEDVS